MVTGTKPVKPVKNEELPSPFRKVLPGFGIGKDKLLMTLHIYRESIILQNHDTGGGGKSFRIVDAHDIASALAGEMNFSSGLLPGDKDNFNTLWWSHSKSGPVTALWMPQGIRRLALAIKQAGPPERYDVPLPGLIFLCRPGYSPWVYAIPRRPAGPKDRVYKAPLPNIYENGNTCAGSQRYGNIIEQIPETFLRSFFTSHISDGKSKRFRDITGMWQELDKKKAKEYPLSDLYYHGTVKDLMEMRI